MLTSRGLLSKPCLENLISKDTHLVFSIYYLLVIEFINSDRQVKRLGAARVYIPVVLWYHIDVMEDKTVEVPKLTGFFKPCIHHTSLIEDTVPFLYQTKHALQYSFIDDTIPFLYQTKHALQYSFIGDTVPFLY